MTFPVAKLGEVCSFVRGLTYSKSDEVEFSSNVVVRATNIDLSTHKLDFSELRYISDSIQVRDEKRLKKNDILICTASGSKSHLGKVALVDDDLGMAFGGFMGALRVNPTKITPKYLFTFLVSSEFKRHIESLSDGANINNLKFSQIEQLELPLPPLATQQKIVSKLDAIFAEIDKATSAAEANACNTKQLFQAYLRQVFESNSEFKNVEIGEVCTIVNGGTPKSEIGEYWDGELNWITPKEMGKLNSREITNTERKITEKGLKNSSAKLLPINSVILSSRAPIGHLAINKSLMATNQGCKGLVPSNSLHYEFLYYFLLHSKQLLNDMGSGATFKELSGSKLATVEIPLPPLSTQHTIVATLDALSLGINKSSNSYTGKANELANLRQSILRQAFAGELVKE